jgi:hypothetical protein
MPCLSNPQYNPHAQQLGRFDGPALLIAPSAGYAGRHAAMLPFFVFHSPSPWPMLKLREVNAVDEKEESRFLELLHKIRSGTATEAELKEFEEISRQFKVANFNLHRENFVTEAGGDPGNIGPKTHAVLERWSDKLYIGRMNCFNREGVWKQHQEFITELTEAVQSDRSSSSG